MNGNNDAYRTFLLSVSWNYYWRVFLECPKAANLEKKSGKN